MNPIRKYRKSPINTITIKYGEELISIDMAKALLILESTMEEEIKTQPSYYFFISALHKKLLTTFERLKVRRKQVFAQLLEKARNKRGPSGRYLSDTDAKAVVEKNKKFIRTCERCIEARDQADQLYSAVRAFEMRANLLQTLSSNLRKQV